MIHYKFLQRTYWKLTYHKHHSIKLLATTRSVRLDIHDRLFRDLSTSPTFMLTFLILNDVLRALSMHFPRY
jgi:hypothetical protein